MVRWYETECYTCGTKFHWSRTQEKDINRLIENGGVEEALCESCESYRAGCEKGSESISNDIGFSIKLEL